jgi:superfamily I DNA and/or RNA helicase
MQFGRRYECNVENHKAHTTFEPHTQKQLLLSANVIFCTLASAGGAVMRKTSRIDDLIVDEAAAATEPELCIPLHLRPKRLLAVGDPLQLPATVLSRRAMDLGLAKSLHERLMHECEFDYVMLNVQYRMSCQISAFPSARFYKSQIGNGPNVSGPLYLNGARLLHQLPYCLLQVEGKEEQGVGGSYCNRREAEKVANLIVDLQNIAQRESPHGSLWHTADRIRVITFYQAQVSLIKRCLHERGLGNKILVATVDSSQGCEADVVILSFVRSHTEWSNRPTAGFLTDDRRVNVALTRAKYQLIGVGNVQCLGRLVGADTETLQCLAADATRRGLVRTGTSTMDSVQHRLDLFYNPSHDHSASKRFRAGR